MLHAPFPVSFLVLSAHMYVCLELALVPQLFIVDGMTTLQNHASYNIAVYCTQYTFKDILLTRARTIALIPSYFRDCLEVGTASLSPSCSAILRIITKKRL